MTKFIETDVVAQLKAHQKDLYKCRLCPNMIGPVVAPQPVDTKVVIVGQAPGPREGEFGRPFAWTAGVTLFRWFQTIGLDESQIRSRTYIAAVCRCFPGKTKSGGDRVPSPTEVEACQTWLRGEFRILKPELVIPVGKLAIEQFLPCNQLTDIVGQQFRKDIFGKSVDIIPLPHPSGASTWFKREPGKSLLQDALALIGKHPSWQKLLTL